MPGLLVHGSGNFVLGRTQTATRLLLLEGIGVGLLGIGGVTLFASGAARDLTGPAATFAIAGIGLFSVSWAADVYGTLAPPGGFGRDPGWVPAFEAELGYRYVYDPQFDYRHFLFNQIQIRAKRLRFTPSVWSSPNDGNQRLRAELAYRPLGPSVGTLTQTGSFVEFQIAATDHRYAREGFEITSLESVIEGRWDLASYDAFLRGAFVDFGVGLGRQLLRWDAGDDNTGSSTLLLGGFGFGVYVGDQTPTGGYYRIYYDHRHDGYAAGLLIPGLGSGVAGHFGLEGVHYFDEFWGLRAEAEVGAAFVTGLSGLFRFGGRP